MLLELVFLIISDLIGIYLLVTGTCSSIEDLIGSSSYNSYYIEYEYSIRAVIFLIILFIIARNSIKRNSVNITYRIKTFPFELDLFTGNLENQPERILLKFKKSNDKSFWISFLSKLGFTLLVTIEYPLGIEIGTDREHMSTDFKIIREKTQCTYYTLFPYANGVRQIYIDVSLRNDTSFGGDDPINIKTYITFKADPIIYFIKLELGNVLIDIKSSGGSLGWQS